MLTPELQGLGSMYGCVVQMRDGAGWCTIRDGIPQLLRDQFFFRSDLQRAGTVI